MLPDIELLVTTYLRVQMGRKVVTDLPGEDTLAAVLPVIRVTRTAGEDRDYRLDHPIVDIDVFAATRKEASAVSRQVQDLLRNHLPYEGAVQPTGVVTSVDTVVGPRWLPDSNSNLRRFQASYQIAVHA